MKAQRITIKETGIIREKGQRDRTQWEARADGEVIPNTFSGAFVTDLELNCKAQFDIWANGAMLRSIAVAILAYLDAEGSRATDDQLFVWLSPFTDIAGVPLNHITRLEVTLEQGEIPAIRVAALGDMNLQAGIPREVNVSGPADVWAQFETLEQ